MQRYKKNSKQAILNKQKDGLLDKISKMSTSEISNCDFY